MEALPAVDSVVLMQRGHEYAWARMAALAGARVEWVEDIAAALARGGAAAVLHPAHLDSAALGIDEVAALAARRGRPGGRRCRLHDLPARRAGALVNRR